MYKRYKIHDMYEFNKVQREFENIEFSIYEKSLREPIDYIKEKEPTDYEIEKVNNLLKLRSVYRKF